MWTLHKQQAQITAQQVQCAHYYSLYLVMLRSLTLLARRSYTTASNAPSYFVARTSNNGIPVYTDFKNGGTQQLTIIRRIEGDAEALKNEIVALFPDAPNNFARVNPVNNHIILKGIHMNEIKEWLIQKGF